MPSAEKIVIDNIAIMPITVDQIDIRAMDGYQEVLAKAIEYDRVITIAQNDDKFIKMFNAKETFKNFCVDAYRNGKKPIDLLNALHLDGSIKYTKGSTKQRVVSKINKYHEKLHKHMDEPVHFHKRVFTIDRFFNFTANKLFTRLRNVYDVMREHVAQKDGYNVTQEYYHDVKKGDEESPGLVKSLKKGHPELVKTPEHTKALKQALVEDGITNEKTLSKIDTIEAKVHKPKTK